MRAALSWLVAGAIAIVPARALAQTYDFATCDPAVTKITPCSTTTTRCCYIDTSPASAFNQSGTDYALVIPMDSCHQGSGADDGGKYPGSTASSFWCRKPTNAGEIFKVYGLVYRMMQVGIPAYWVINPSKDPPAMGCTNPGSCRQIATDVDIWIMDAAATTPPGATTDLSGPNASMFIKRWTLTSAGGFAADTTWSYDKQQFPLRSGAFVIAATDRAKFNAFVRRQVPYDKWAANPVRSCGNGSSCQDFSGIDFFEIQPTASIGYTDFVANPTGTPGATAYQAGRMPVAGRLAYTPPRVANRPGPSGVSKKWLEQANLKDDANAGCGGTTMFTPSDAVLCDLTQAEIIAGNLKSKNFGWLWLDHKAPSCGAELTAIQDFLTATATTSAGNVMAIADGTSNESCANQQLLGKQQATAGLDTPNGNAPGRYIYRYPANMMSQWGNEPADFANGLGGGGFTFSGGSFGYNAAFTGATNSLHRLVTVDVSSGTNTYCPYNKSIGVCDVMGGVNGETKDLAMYGRYLNGDNNGIVFYLPGTQIHNTAPELKMLLDSLLAIPLGTVEVTSTTTEVTRSAPVAAVITNTDALVQGTYEVTSPVTTPATMSLDADASTFTFPATKGHLRAIPASTGLNTTFRAASKLFDAADAVPPATPGGCAAHFTASCRTVFTTTTSGFRPALTHLDTQTATVSALGPVMAANLNATSRSTLISRVLAGRWNGSSFYSALGGIDRSTAAVIEASPVTGGVRPTMAYVGGVDGMLHAICASTQSGTGCDVVGRELWAYIPRTLLPYLRYNTARIDGSPAVRDAFGDFNGDGLREWRTILMFQTAMGDVTDAARLPAVYALDITNPSAPVVLWEYALANPSTRGAYELGAGMTIGAGVVMMNGKRRELGFAQTNNGGTAGAGSVVTAIDLETGQQVWQVGYAYANPPRATSGANAVPAGGIPGGAVVVDRAGGGLVTDLVYGDLYGNLWRVDPATGANRYGTTPLFAFSTNYHAIGAKPAIYSDGGAQYAVFASGGFADPSDTNWGSGVQQHVVSVSLSAPVSAAPLDEGDTAHLGFKYALGSTDEKGYAQVLVVGNQIFVTTDTADVNSQTYGATGASSGKLYTLSFDGSGSSTVIVNGASSVVRSDNATYAGAGTTLQYATAATPGGTRVDPEAVPRVTRKLWVRTE
ncbi:MAG TPA: hypothetical protein VIV11_11975 [Kofleriaceae bacterium]